MKKIYFSFLFLFCFVAIFNLVKASDILPPNILIEVTASSTSLTSINQKNIYKGAKDVILGKFFITNKSTQELTVDLIEFSLVGRAVPGYTTLSDMDIKNIKIINKNNSLFEPHKIKNGVIINALDFSINAGVTEELVVKADVSNSARTGDFFKLMINAKNSIKVKDSDDRIVQEEGIDGIFPVQSLVFSIKENRPIKLDVVKVVPEISFVEPNKSVLALEELKQLVSILESQKTQTRSLVNKTQMQLAIDYFINYGVDKNTIKLGKGERLAVINSYKSAFGYLPQTESDFNDLVKIANGSIPNKKSKLAEDKAKEQFIKIYAKIPDFNDFQDNAAFFIIAYGMRQEPENRNLYLEEKGVQIFTNIYNYIPRTINDWNIVQAITYSGAKREIDTDADLLIDRREIIFNTNWQNPDTDNDGYKDGIEVLNGFDPLR